MQAGVHHGNQKKNRVLCVKAHGASLSVQEINVSDIIWYIRIWHEWKQNKCHWTAIWKKKVVLVFVTLRPRLGCVLSSVLSSIQSLRWHTTWRTARWRSALLEACRQAHNSSNPPPPLPLQSISALNLDVGRNTSESSRPCSCWPACLLLWKRPRRPKSEGWLGSAVIGTWSPGWGRSRAGWRLASAASWILISYSGTKSLPAGQYRSLGLFILNSTDSTILVTVIKDASCLCLRQSQRGRKLRALR